MYPIRGVPFRLTDTPYTLLYRPRPFGDTQLILALRDIETTTALAGEQLTLYRAQYGDEQQFSHSASGPLGGVFRYPSSNAQIVFREHAGAIGVPVTSTFKVAAKTITGIRGAAYYHGYVEEAWITVLEQVGRRMREVGWVDLRVLEGGVRDG
ncbi:uncharacterized protein KY384_008611 [Bacidia gigantensis]|uniref:uncharacterized protein n=1 Tax=Bacidia gigantensis TaxID=2732470 RepID=UPI001D0541E7|nr:uncharacterized protein KY384_008611 [Bacidia gigantensis]KAG8527181.1 hypothetical protein KY384_008611 [Bacidia gigantensis]